MKRFLLLSLIILFVGEISNSMPAYPNKIAVNVNGHRQYIRLFGNEKNKRAETEDGYTIIQNEDQQWCYASLNSDSCLIASNWKLGSNRYLEEDFSRFLDMTPKHLNSNRPSPQEPTIRKGAKKAIGQRRVLIILMGYQDLQFSKSKSEFYNLFNEEGYYEDNARGSVKDYFLSVSYNQLQLDSDIYGPYTTDHDMAYYGKNQGMKGEDSNTYALFEEAINKVSQEADLSLYDGDNDGFIDNVHIIFAGYGEEAGAASNAIWSHEATFYRPYEIQELKIDRYSCAPELRGNSGNGITRIGPHCHEIGHALGAMDYYDVNYASNGEFLGTGEWDVMASGSWNNEGVTPADFNPYVKAFNFGWISLNSLPTGEVKILPSYIDKNNYYILKSSEYGDYYLLENRSRKNLEDGLPGEGLLIYHVHSDIVNAGNDINVSAPQKLYLVCASSKSPQPNKTPASYGEINSDGCPYPGSSRNMNFGQSSIPKAFFWDDDVCGIELNNITLNQDGVIVLTNNSVGASYEPIDMKNLFFEGFENENAKSIYNLNNTAWTIEFNPENTQTFIDKPVALEGVRSLQLSAKKSSTDVTDAIEFSCNLQKKGKARIKIWIVSLYPRFNKSNIVKIGYRTSDTPDWQYVEIKSSENNRWRQSFIDLPDDVQHTFRIESTVLAGSIIGIDNIEVEQVIEKEETDNARLLFADDTSGTIYSMYGYKSHKIHKGLSIVRNGKGEAKIVFMK